MKNTHYCEECVEEIAEEDVFWEDDRAYCGQCGSELEPIAEETDLVDEFSSRRLRRLYSTDDDDGDDEIEVEPEEEEFDDDRA